MHVNVLRRLFRGKVLGLITEAHAQGRLQFFGNLAPLADKKTFKRFLAPLRRIKWVVYCKDPFGGPSQVLRYLSRCRLSLNATSITADLTGTGVAFTGGAGCRLFASSEAKRMRQLPNQRLHT